MQGCTWQWRRLMFDKEISGEVPEHRTFIYETAIPWLRRAGLNVKILRANTTYKECFTKTIQRGKGKGKSTVHDYLFCALWI